MKIRTRIIMAFLSLLIVPFLVVILGLVLINSEIIPIPGVHMVYELGDNIDQMEKFINNHPDRIQDREYISSGISPYMSDSIKRVLIFDLSRTVLYDSENKLDGLNLNDIDITANEEVGTDDFISETQIISEGRIIGSIQVYPNLDKSMIYKMMFYLPIILISIFILTIIAMMIILSKVLTDGILKPLSELNYAADRISNGDLDFEMKYTDDNEIGKFCNEFDKMRLRLKYVLDKQNRYEKSRKELIASISHDLKTPLTSIKGYIEGLQDGIVQDEETYQRYLEVIHQKTIRLNHLIDDLFMFSKLELNEFKIDLENVKSDVMMERILKEKEIDFLNLSIDLQIERPFKDAILRVDEKRISQIIDNLVGNAAKFAKSTIKIYTKKTDDYFEIYVEDDGIGISQSDIPYIFDHFYKVDKSRTGNTLGTGLGLAICKQLAEAHGGNISVSSIVDKGSIFKVTIPTIPKEYYTSV